MHAYTFVLNILQGYNYAGIDKGYYCWCANTYAKYGRVDTCDKPCRGDSSKICGGERALSVYNTSEYCFTMEMNGVFGQDYIL